MKLSKGIILSTFCAAAVTLSTGALASGDDGVINKTMDASTDTVGKAVKGSGNVIKSTGKATKDVGDTVGGAMTGSDNK